MEERRIMAVRDGRRLPPRNSRGEFRRRRSRRDRGMDYAGEDMRMRDYGDMTRRGRYGDYGEDMRGDYEGGDMRGRGRSDYGNYGMDGHHMGNRGGYEPIEFMGYCSGYYGMPEEDYARGGRGSRMDYGYDRRGGDYRRYDRGDYGYDDYGDYGETLSEQELDKWCKHLVKQLDEREKQMLSKDAIIQKAKQLGIEMKDFTEKEFYVNVLKNYTDHKQTIGQNPDVAIRLSRDDFHDKDGEYKGSEWLAIYFDTFVANKLED